MIISKTPVRLSFFGGGTDYREYFERKGGAVLGVTIDKHIYVSVNVLSDFFEYNIRVGYSKSELVKKIDDIVHPSVRETLRFKKMSGNLDIHIFADLPAKTGLGSSSSFTVGLLNALYALEGKAVSKKKLGEEAIFIEQQMIKEHVGCQDQIHAAYGGLNIIEFNRYETTVRPVVISKEKYRLLNASLMVFYTGLTRYASKIAEEQVTNTKKRNLDGYLSQMHQMVFNAERIISDETSESMIRQLGELLNEGWQLKKNLSKKITNATIDAAYEKALEAGAYGGKLGGAGGGGFLFLLVPEGQQASVRMALHQMMEVHFNFETEGSKIIYLTQ